MEVLRQGNPGIITYKIECGCCGCVMLYTDNEIKKDKQGSYVECPTCAERLNLVNAKKVSRDYDHCDWCVHAKSYGWDGNECTISKWHECKTDNWKHFQAKQAIR